MEFLSRHRLVHQAILVLTKYQILSLPCLIYKISIPNLSLTSCCKSNRCNQQGTTPRAMSPLQLSSQKLFLPSRHMWLRILEAPLSSHLSRMPWMINVGLTERGLDDIGDITSIQISSQFKMPSHESLKSPNNGNKNNPIPVPVPVRYGQDIVKLNWDGHLITKADELYHTVWETISETTSVVAPVDGEVCEIHCKEDDQWVDSDTALLTMSTDGDLIEMRKDEWMHAEEYEEYVYAMEKGKFFDSDLEA
eukprot:scaffold435_cov275-Chaetoceros_neogracile.AAC.21